MERPLNLCSRMIRALALIAMLLFGAVHPLAAGAMPDPDEARFLAFGGDICADRGIGAAEQMATDCPLCHLPGAIQPLSPPPEGTPRLLVWLEPGLAQQRVPVPDAQWSDLLGAPRGPPDSF